MSTETAKPDTTEAPPTTLTVPAAALRALLGRIRHFASRDDTLPALHGVHLAGSSGRLVASATDRYVMARDSVEATGELPPCLLSLRDAKVIRRVLSPYARGAAGYSCSLVELSVVGNEMSALGNTLTVGVTDGQLAWPTVSIDSFPLDAVDQSLAGWTDERSAEGIAIAAGNLAKFTKVADHLDPVRVWLHGPEKPAHIRIGKTFHGVVMPVRLRDGTSLDVPATPDSAREGR